MSVHLKQLILYLMHFNFKVQLKTVKYTAQHLKWIKPFITVVLKPECVLVVGNCDFLTTVFDCAKEKYFAGVLQVHFKYLAFKD